MNGKNSADYLIKKCGDYFKILFKGQRSLSMMEKNWIEVRQYVTKTPERLLVEDIMKGKLDTNEVAHLISRLDIYRRSKIAIILNEEDSYNHHFFDSVAKYNRLKIKHFSNINMAKDWLVGNDEC